MYVPSSASNSVDMIVSQNFLNPLQEMSKYRNITFIGDRYETEWFLRYASRPTGAIKNMPFQEFYSRLKLVIHVKKALEIHFKNVSRYLGARAFIRLDGAKIELMLSNGPKLHVNETFPYSASLDSSLNDYPIQLEVVYFKNDRAYLIERDIEQHSDDGVKAAIANSQ
jgi:hypothetical protein